MGSEFSQPSIVKETKAKLGDNVTLSCFFQNKQMKNNLFWYKQALGYTPRVIGMVKTYSTVVLYQEFNNTRFRITKNHDSLNLSLKMTKSSDEALYFCGSERSHDIEFQNGTLLTFQGSLLCSSQSCA